MNLPSEQVYIFYFLIAALVFSLSVVLFLKYKKQKTSPVQKPEAVELSGIAVALAKTRQALSHKIDALVLQSKQIDDKFLDSLEELLYTSDLGVATVEKLLTAVRQKLSRGELSNISRVKEALSFEMSEILKKATKPQSSMHSPEVILVVGVNGVGKTTSIGKLAHYYTQKGKQVMLVAGDTFRAAAQDQLRVWSERANSNYYATTQTQDPAAVAFQGLEKALSDKNEVVIIDTAGRLHNKENLMDEMKKIKKVLQKIIPDAPHQVLLVIDANSGQNAIQQAKTFNEALGLTGLIVTKLDGTAKGGVIVGISQEVGVVPQFIGLGEKMADLALFSPQEFANSLLEI